MLHRASGLTCYEAAASTEVVGHEAEHEVVVGVVEAVRLHLVVEGLRDEAHCHVSIKHDSTGLGKELWLHKMVTVHHHQNIAEWHLQTCAAASVTTPELHLWRHMRLEIPRLFWTSRTRGAVLWATLKLSLSDVECSFWNNALVALMTLGCAHSDGIHLAHWCSATAFGCLLHSCKSKRHPPGARKPIQNIQRNGPLGAMKNHEKPHQLGRGMHIC